MPSKPLVLVAAVVAALAAIPAAASAQGDPRDAALSHLGDNAGDFGVTRADVADVTIASSYRSAHSGVTHVNVDQRHEGLEVFEGHATVNIASGGRVIFAGGSLVRGLAATGPTAADIDAPEAVEEAADGLKLDEPSNLRVLRSKAGRARETVVSGGGISDEPIPARLGWQPTDDGLRLAWQLVIDDASDTHLWNATVDARTGSLLDADDWTEEDSVDALASTLQRSDAAGAAADTVTPDPVNDGSSYSVFAFPKDSPNDGPRTIVTNPADAPASPFGWHDTDGAAGPEFTLTRGNNVHAYLDQDDTESPDFGDGPSGGPGLDFDFPLDLTEHPQNNRDPATANLFYVNNMIHDVLWRYGFDDTSGNFQANNYGRGGAGGDPVQAEVADGQGTNNANFSTPALDGGAPRMQMYLWPGNGLGPQNSVTVDGLGAFGASWSRFTPAPTNAGLPGHRLIHGGTGCSADTYPEDLPQGDWIAVVDGGTDPCTYLQRVQVAEALDAKAVVVAHNAAGSAPILSGSLAGPPVKIPAVAVTQADGGAIKAAIAAGRTTGDVHRNTARPPMRDGSLDNGIIIHEYGHGVSNRLTGGPTVNCLSGDERSGEGWSDYLAVTLLLDPARDDPEGTRGLAPYALYQPSRTSNGLRPRPYSRNMDIQPFTYDSIKTGGWLNGASLATPHGVGHGWAAILWDMTWELIDRHGFNPDIYGAWNSGGNNRSFQYVIDGMKLQGCDPGFVVQRDAIIAAADELSDGADTCTLWATFARRGLGYSAVQGTSASRNDNKEAFDTHPACRRRFTGGAFPLPTFNTVRAGDAFPLRFTADGYRGLDVLARNAPYSRLVDCRTLETVGPGPFITPRPTPVPTETPGGSRLTVNAQGVFHYPWKTEAAWAGTCREVVATRKDGRQHRAYFRFTA